MEAANLKSRTFRLVMAVIAVAAILVGLAGGYFYCRHSHIGGIRNVVLISIDTCRADRLSCYGYRRPTTPHIDAVAADGVLFNMALTPVPMTTPAHSSMFTGAYPPTHGVHLNDGDHLSEANVTLAEILQKAGYQTAAFVGGFPLHFIFGLNQGFDTYDCQFTKKEGQTFMNERKGEEVSSVAMTWLEQHAAKPFFLFLHYYDPHLYYDPPPPYAAAYANDPYAGEIAYVDACIGQVLDRLRALGVYDSTLIIITGDHGESLDEHGEHTHAFFVYQSTLHVPMVIQAPRARRGHRVEENVSLVDIVPTVLDLVGLQTPSQVQGVSLRRCLEGNLLPERQRPIYCESLEPASFGCSPLHGIVEDQWKYIRAPKEELYDLRGGPGERDNVFEKQPQVAQQLRGRLEVMLQQMKAATPQSGHSVVDPEAVKRLQSLGYVGGGATPQSSTFDATSEDPKDFLLVYERILRAYSLITENRREEAKKELLEIVTRRPQLILPLQALAQIAIAEHRSADAKEYTARIMSILDKSKDSSNQGAANFVRMNCHTILGQALLMEGKTDEAAPEFENALLIEPNSTEAHLNLATALLQMGKTSEVIEHYEKALRIKPNDPEVHDELGNILAAQGKMTEAINHYTEAVRLKPGYAEAHNDLGNALLGQGKTTEAISHCTEALRLKPKFAAAHNNLGNALATQGKMTEAIDQYRETLRIDPNYAETHNNLANALAARGQTEEAIRHYEDALRIRPNYARAHFNLGKELAHHGKLHEAEIHFREALRLEPSNANASLYLAKVLQEQGQSEAALQIYTELLRLQPDRIDALNGSAWIRATDPAAKLRDGATAVRLAERATELTNRKVARVLDTLAAAYAEAGRFPEALATAREAAGLAATQKDTNLTAQIEQRMSLYQAGKPYRETVPSQPEQN